MKKILILVLAGVLLLSACGATAGDIEVHDPWARPTAQGQNAAVYFRIHNHTNTTDELIGASSNISDTVEIHESKMENAVMSMSMLSSLLLGPDEEVNFTPGGYHIMLVGIKQEIKPGDHIGIILHFKTHDDIVVNVSVGDEPASDTEHDHE